MLDKSGCTADK